MDSASNAVNSTSFDAIPAVGLVDSLQTALGADNVNTALSSVYTPMSLTTNKEVSEAPIDQIKAQESSWQSDYNDVAVVTFTRAGSEGNDSALTTAEDRNYLGLSKRGGPAQLSAESETGRCFLQDCCRHQLRPGNGAWLGG